jgi:excinuclease UvrABC nuclease subunit
MKMCLAPCFQGCTDEAYAAEVGRVQAWLDSGGQSLVRELEAQREEASAALAFEQASAIHARIDKAHGIAGPLPEIVRRLDRLSGVMVQPAAEAEAVTLLRVEGGRLGEPIVFPVQARAEGKMHSMESRVTECLAAHAAPRPGSALELMEELALLKRWYYRSSRVGEIFFADDQGELPLRRLVRGISRVFQGEHEPAAPAEKP